MIETCSPELEEKLVALGFPKGYFTAEDFLSFFPDGYMFIFDPVPGGYEIRGTKKLNKVKFFAETLMDAKAKMLIYLKENKII